MSASRSLVDSDNSNRAEGEYIIATIPTAMSSAQLYYHSQGPDPYTYDLQATNANWTFHTSQPIVMGVCTKPSSMPGDIYYVKDDGSKSILPNITGLFDNLDDAKLDGDGFTRASSGYRPLWIPSPGDSPSLLGLFPEERVDASGQTSMGVTVCTISSFWRTSLTTLTVTGMGAMVETDFPQSRQAMASDNLRPITIIPEDMPTLHNSRVEFEEDIWGEPGLLALNFALAISSIHAADPPSKVVEGFDRPDLSSFKIDELVEGYGYGSVDTPILLSLAVIISYCAITLLYMTYLVTTGHTSTAWSSATEFVMLALQSQPADNVKNVSVGIDTMNMFRRSVGIRVKTEINEYSERIEEKLELVFADRKDVENRGLRKVERNKAY